MHSEKTLTSPWRVVGVAWAILLAILLVYSGDIRSWAAMTDSAQEASAVKPLAGALYSTAQVSGVLALIDGVQQRVRAYYEAQPLLGARDKASAPALNCLWRRRR